MQFSFGPPTFRRLFILLLVVAWPAVHATGPLTLRDGERFVYRVSWGLFRHAGTITVTATSETLEGLPQTRITTETSTRGLIRALYPFDGHVESVFDLKTGRMLAARATTSAGRKHRQAAIVFDYAEGVGRYVDFLRAERSTDLRIPTEYPMDLITSIINTRAWAIRPGETRTISVLFDDEFYELAVTAERVETIRMPGGNQEALLLVPRMEGEPKGMFRRGGEVRVWLAENEDRLPLRFEVALGVGSGTATLTDYQPPRKATARADADPDL